MAKEFKTTRTRATGFTPPAIDNLKPESRPYEVAEPGGLRLVVGKRSKTFAYRYQSPTTGKAAKLTLGRWPGKGLAEARSAVATARQQVEDGIDPQAQRMLVLQSTRATPTVAVLVDEFIAQLPASKRTRGMDADYLKRDVIPVWGAAKVTAIARRDVRALIETKAKAAPVGAGHLLGYVRRLFAYAVDHEIIASNPAAGIKPPAKATQGDRTLDPGEIKIFWDALPAMEASKQTRLMLKFALVTGQRIGEIRKLQWTDIAGDWWTIPAAVSKNKLTHRVYLTAMARDLLDQARAVAGDSAHVFPGKPPVDCELMDPRAAAQKKQTDLMDRGAALHALDRNRDKLPIPHFTVHDIRRTVASQMTGMGFGREAMVKKVLNHADRGVTAIYDRYGYDREKMVVMNAWADRLGRIIAGGRVDAGAGELETVLARLEALHQQDPTNGRHAMTAIARATAAHRVPPDWAIEACLKDADRLEVAPADTTESPADNRGGE
jgi:integrase